MGIKAKKRNGRSRRRSASAMFGRGQQALLTYSLGPSSGPCDCPICQHFGIDPNASDEPQVMVIDDDADFAFLMAQMARLRS